MDIDSKIDKLNDEIMKLNDGISEIESKSEIYGLQLKNIVKTGTGLRYSDKVSELLGKCITDKLHLIKKREKYKNEINNILKDKEVKQLLKEQQDISKLLREIGTIKVSSSIKASGSKVSGSNASRSNASIKNMMNTLNNRYDEIINRLEEIPEYKGSKKYKKKRSKKHKKTKKKRSKKKRSKKRSKSRR